MNEQHSAGSTDAKLWRVKVEVIQKFDIEVTAASAEAARTVAIELTDDEAPVESFVSDVTVKELNP